ncbi:MAG: cofilin [Geoglossum umbratile]|nr:MAG: cofilin [Geoglossum umbratile]
MFKELELKRELKYIIYKISDDFRTIAVEEAGTDKDWNTFREKLVNAKTKGRGGEERMAPRYAVYDFEYEAKDGSGLRSKIVFLVWSPDDAGIFSRMLYASSKAALKHSLGFAAEIQANSEEDIVFDAIIVKVSKGN